MSAQKPPGGHTQTREELACLYHVSRLMSRDDASVDLVLEAVADRVAAGLGAPGTAGVRIATDATTRASDGFRESATRVVAPIVATDGNRCGTVEACFHGTRPAVATGPGPAGLLEAVARDIAVFLDRRSVLCELRERDLRQSEALRVARLGFWARDILAGRMHWSEEGCRILGRTPEELEAAHTAFIDTVHPDDRKRVRESLNYALHTGGTFSVEHRIAKLDGVVRHVHTKGRVSRDDRGVPVHMVGTVADITERKNLERQLVEAQKMDAIGRLAGGVAHDFNNILTVILSFGAFVQEALPPGAPAAEDMAEVLAAADRAIALTRQLLAFSRRQIAEPKVVDINAHVLATDKMLRRLLGADIELATLPAEDLWKTRIDPGHLEQVLVNLAVNARDAMPRGGKLTIETRNVVLGEECVAQHQCVMPGEHVMLAVSDSGTGMNEETRQHVFEPFYTTKASGQGTGLGLATCYGIVKQAGGSIWIYSEVGHGTTVKVHLPRARGSAEAFVAASEPVPIVGGTETVLVVEDDHAVRAMAVRTLERLGYHVLEAENGGEALRVFERIADRVDLVLADMIMPQLGGRELASRLLRAHAGTKMLFMSGYTDAASLRADLLPRRGPFLQKPFMPEDLARKVRAVLDERPAAPAPCGAESQRTLR